MTKKIFLTRGKIKKKIFNSLSKKAVLTMEKNEIKLIEPDKNLF